MRRRQHASAVDRCRSHERHRGEPSESRLRLQTAVRLRWFGVIGQLVTVCFVYLVPRLSACRSASAWPSSRCRPGSTSSCASATRRARASSTPFATCLLAYDILQLAALLYLTGGIENPFTFLLVAPVTVSAATLPPRNTIALGLLAARPPRCCSYSSICRCPGSAGRRSICPTLYNIGLLASVLSGMIFLALYAWRLAKEARQMADALAATEMVLAREQQLHALDGLAAAAAHELGTPLSTIAVVAKELARDAQPGQPVGGGYRPAAEPGRALPRDPAEADARADRARPAASRA